MTGAINALTDEEYPATAGTGRSSWSLSEHGTSPKASIYKGDFSRSKTATQPNEATVPTRKFRAPSLNFYCMPALDMTGYSEDVNTGGVSSTSAAFGRVYSDPRCGGSVKYSV